MKMCINSHLKKKLIYNLRYVWIETHRVCKKWDFLHVHIQNAKVYLGYIKTLLITFCLVLVPIRECTSSRPTTAST